MIDAYIFEIRKWSKISCNKLISLIDFKGSIIGWEPCLIDEGEVINLNLLFSLHWDQTYFDIK